VVVGVENALLTGNHVAYGETTVSRDPYMVGSPPGVAWGMDDQRSVHPTGELVRTHRRRDGTHGVTRAAPPL
jgi:hypothetical protein